MFISIQGKDLMLSYIYNNFLSRKQKNRLKRNYYKTNKIFTDLFFKYDEIELIKCLVQLGVGKDDTILLHSSFDYFNGFQGRPQDIIKIFLELLGQKRKPFNGIHALFLLNFRLPAKRSGL